MDTIYTTELVALGASLAELAVKGTATAVSTKIKAIRDEKNTDKVRNTYDEIVSELLLERDEAIRIARFHVFLVLPSISQVSGYLVHVVAGFLAFLIVLKSFQVHFLPLRIESYM